MRESNCQKETVGEKEESLPPGEQVVEVERAWLVDRELARAPETPSGGNQAEGDEELQRQNYARDVGGGRARREERRHGEGQLAERRYDHGAGQHRSSKEEQNRSHKEVESHQGQPWIERGHQGH